MLKSIEKCSSGVTVYGDTNTAIQNISQILPQDRIKGGSELTLRHVPFY